MGMQVNGIGGGKSIQEAMEVLGLNESQAIRLDALDGKDGKIGMSIFNTALAVKNGVVLPSIDSEMVETIKDIMGMNVTVPNEYKDIAEAKQFANDMKAMKTIVDKRLEMLKEYAPKLRICRGSLGDNQVWALRSQFIKNNIPMEEVPFMAAVVRAKMGCIDSNLVPNEIKEKYGENFEALLVEYNNAKIAEFHTKYAEDKDRLKFNEQLEKEYKFQ